MTEPDLDRARRICAELREMMEMHCISPADVATMWRAVGGELDWETDEPFVDEPGVREMLYPERPDPDTLPTIVMPPSGMITLGASAYFADGVNVVLAGHPYLDGKAPGGPCAFGDPLCPCQEGDACNHVEYWDGGVLLVPLELPEDGDVSPLVEQLVALMKEPAGGYAKGGIVPLPITFPYPRESHLLVRNPVERITITDPTGNVVRRIGGDEMEIGERPDFPDDGSMEAAP